jgi:hypothetical protein
MAGVTTGSRSFMLKARSEGEFHNEAQELAQWIIDNPDKSIQICSATAASAARLVRELNLLLENHKKGPA